MKYTARKKQLAIAAALLFAMASPACAAQAEEADAIDAGDVNVTASRTEMVVKWTPPAVEVITREDIDRMGAETLAQALQLATGINVLENGMVGNQSSLRGMNTNQTLILMDGRRIRTENTSQTANYYELQRVNMDDVERIEIVRGAASSLYGADALGGVINIIRKRPGAAGGTVSAAWTSRQKDLGLRVDSGQNGKWNVSGSAHITDIRERGTADSSNMYGKKYYFSLDGRMEVAQNRELGVFFDYMQEDLSAIDSIAAKTDYDHWRLGTGVKYSGCDKKGDWETQFYYTHFDKDQETHTRSAGKLTQFDTMTFDSYVLDGRRTLDLSGKHTLTVGGEWRQEDYESTRIKSGGATKTRDGVTNPLGDSSMQYAAIYLQDEWTPTQKWLIVPSVRWDWNDVFGNEVTAKLGTTYELTKGLRFKANIGTAYRAPTASELYFYWTHIPTARMRVVIEGNPDLQPEKSVNFDIGIEGESGKATGKLTYFRNKVDNLINIHQTVIPGFPVTVYGHYENIDAATMEGIELETTWKFDRHFLLRGLYNYLDARDDSTGARLTGRARDKVSLQLSYENEKGGVSALLWNDWTAGYRYAEGNAAKDTAASTLNFVVRKSFNRDFSAYLGVDNILDKENDVLNYEGRIWRFGVNVKF